MIDTMTGLPGYVPGFNAPDEVRRLAPLSATEHPSRR